LPLQYGLIVDKQKLFFYSINLLLAQYRLPHTIRLGLFRNLPERCIFLRDFDGNWHYLDRLSLLSKATKELNQIYLFFGTEKRDFDGFLDDLVRELKLF
jgi:hypothetical protein